MPCYYGPSRTRDAQGGTPPKAVDHDGIKDNIRGCTRQLPYHGYRRFARSHHAFLKTHISKGSQRKYRNDTKIGSSRAYNHKIGCLRGDKQLRGLQAKQQDGHKIAQRHEYRIACRLTGLSSVSLAETLSDHHIDADAGTYAQSHNQHLYGKGQRQRVDRFVAHMSNRPL